LLPPLLARPIARLWPSNERAVLEYAPRGWNTIDNEPESSGWDNETVVAAERGKWEAFCRNSRGVGPLGFSHESTDLTITDNVSYHNIHLTFGYVLARVAGQRTRISVLDWGGGLGHYYVLGRTMLPELQLDYCCHEVPLMCVHGRELCPDVEFCSDEACLQKEYDLVMINGSLGYFRDWKSILASLSRCAARYLFLTRTLVVDESESFVVLQHTDEYNYNSDMLTQVFNRREMLAVAETAGLKIEREFVVGKGPTIVNAPEQCVDSGWLLRRDA
jgi:putative methyltransferase (TIGR04325 family)